MGAYEEREKEMVRLAHSGDRGAFGELLRLHERRVFSIVRRIIWREEEAMEVAQEIFLQAYKSRHRFRPDRPFRPWLFKIAVNVCHKHVRAGARNEVPTAFSEEAAPMWGGETSDPESVALGRDAANRIGKSMSRLRPRDRALLLLRFWEEMDYAELRHVYGVPQTVLKMRVHRALSRLRTILERDLP